jgi:hypothetical protein
MGDAKRAPQRSRWIDRSAFGAVTLLVALIATAILLNDPRFQGQENTLLVLGVVGCVVFMFVAVAVLGGRP